MPRTLGATADKEEKLAAKSSIAGVVRGMCTVFEVLCTVFTVFEVCPLLSVHGCTRGCDERCNEQGWTSLSAVAPVQKFSECFTTAYKHAHPVAFVCSANMC
jgi:hypothetical protein